MPQQKLEHYKVFPIIAWTLTILFTIFVIHLALRVNETANNLEKTSQNLGEQMRQVEEMFEKKESKDVQ